MVAHFPARDLWCLAAGGLGYGARYLQLRARAARVTPPDATGNLLLLQTLYGYKEHSLVSVAPGLCYSRDMTIKRLDHVSVVVEDLAAAVAFFTTLGMTKEGEAPVEGPWVDRINGLEGVRVDIVMMRTPDGHGRLELTKFRNPKLVEIEPAVAPPNTPGLRSVMFTVESLDDSVARLRADGAELVGEVAQYEDRYRLCYVRGPAGIIVALAEELF
jgi:catechol 2,3-dioxygenase-like lactoylglutathione lyase family enzyme